MQKRMCGVLSRSGGNARRALLSVEPTLRSLLVSAYQSWLFNGVLGERIAGIDRMEPGDMAYKHENGACFLVEDAEAEQSRCVRMEISPTGPIWGYRMTAARGEPGRRESALLSGEGVPVDAFRNVLGARLKGERRPLRVVAEDARVTSGQDEGGAYLELAFALPGGSYATSVVREVTK